MIRRIAIISFVALFLAACGGQSDNHLQEDGNLAIEYVAIEVESIPEPTPTQIPVLAPEPTPTPESEPPTERVPFTPPGVEISEYGRQLAKEFLSDFTTIFTGMAHAETTWDHGRRVAVPTGRFILHDSTDHQRIVTYDRPEISFLRTYGGDPEGFFDGQGNRIENAPWALIGRHENAFNQEGQRIVSYSFHYAGYFRLFDFDGDGIPEIFIHFNQTFDGGYAGFYLVFKYADGEYRALGFKTFEDGEESTRYSGWFGRFDLLFLDENNRVIRLIDSWEFSGLARYDHLVLTDTYVEFHLIVDLSFDTDDWGAWQEHHGHHHWGQGLRDNLTIFGTDILLIPIQSLTDLENEVMAEISKKLLGN